MEKWLSPRRGETCDRNACQKGQILTAPDAVAQLE